MIIRAKGVHRYVSKGVVYYYHRKTGTRIESIPGTPAFFSQIQQLNDKASGKKSAAPGTLGGLIAAYRTQDNPDWAVLAEDTKRGYQEIFSYLKPLDAARLAEIDTPYLVKVRDKCFAKRKRNFTNKVVAQLTRLFKWGIPRGWMTTNPAKDVPKIRAPKGQIKKRRAWELHEVKAVFAALDGGMAIGVMLGYWCGLSLKDIVSFPRYKAERGEYKTNARELTYGRSKTGVGTTVPVAEEAALAFDAEIARLKDSPAQPMTLVVNSRNQPYTRDGFKTMFYRTIGDLVKAGAIQRGVTLHGLRHTIGKDIVDAGGDADDTAAALAQDTSAMGRHYSKERDKAARSDRAMRKVIEKREGKS